MVNYDKLIFEWSVPGRKGVELPHILYPQYSLEDSAHLKRTSPLAFSRSQRTRRAAALHEPIGQKPRRRNRILSAWAAAR
jgi:hypothetical protein